MTILHVLSTIASEQSNTTQRTMKRVNQLLDYMYYNSDAVIRFYASGMILKVHFDTSYFSAGKGRSRAGRYCFLGNMPRPNIPIQLKGNIYITCAILKLIASSASKAELGALFVNTTTNSFWIRTSPTGGTNSCWQHHSGGNCQLYHEEVKVTSNGNEIFLAPPSIYSEIR